MSTGNAGKTTWRKTGVAIRSDIFEEAEHQHIDISYECNAALAKRLGFPCTGINPPGAADAMPVIVAHEPVPEQKMIRPVINADDPATPQKVLNEKKKMPKPKPVTTLPEVVPEKHDRSAKKTPLLPESRQGPTERAGKPKATTEKKRTNAIKKFVTTRIIRAEDDVGTETIIPKDDLYQLFSRWCRDHDIQPVPDHRSFAVALKTTYAFSERSIGGIPYWVKIRLK